jgi:hypothetical protein
MSPNTVMNVALKHSGKERGKPEFSSRIVLLE